jgi:AmmeMemoRadiSam system protein A
MSSALTPEEKQALLRVARRALEAAVRGQRPPGPEAGLPARLRAPGCSFVTLTRGGKLRGCIGGLQAEAPLHEDVARRAAQAALRDYRFPPVTPDELRDIEVEVSVLTPPEPLSYAGPDDLAARLRPGLDGVVLEWGGRKATFLPQVWEHAPDAEEFLGLLCEKLGVQADAWRTLPLSVWVYAVIKFTEGEFGARPAGEQAHRD